MAQRNHQRLKDDQLLRLWRACDSGNMSLLTKLMQSFDPDLDELDQGFWQAIKHGNLAVIRYLLGFGYPVGGEEIKHALTAKSIPCLEIFRDYGWEDVNMNLSQGNRACNALTFSAGNPTIVSYLLARGADPDLGPEPDYYDYIHGTRLTPKSGVALHTAALYGSVQSVDLLLAYGAGPTIGGLIHAATRGGSTSVMERVLQAGADIDGGDDLHRHRYPAYSTSLHRTIKTGKVELVRLLLEKGASVTKPDHQGRHALQIVRMECCGGRGQCREGLHAEKISLEIQELVENAAQAVHATVGEAIDEVPRP